MQPIGSAALRKRLMRIVRQEDMIDTRTLQIRPIHESDVPLLAAAFADMNKTREQYERYWQENVEGKRTTLVALLYGSVG